jgi:hypothetical protein
MEDDAGTVGSHSDPEMLTEPVLDTQNNPVSEVELVPAKILGFIEDLHGDLQVIIHSCYGHPKKESVLTKRWMLEFEEDDNVQNTRLKAGSRFDDTSNKTPFCRIVPVDCIERHCLMLPYHHSSHFMLELSPQTTWHEHFCSV